MKLATFTIGLLAALAIAGNAFGQTGGTGTGGTGTGGTGTGGTGTGGTGTGGTGTGGTGSGNNSGGANGLQQVDVSANRTDPDSVFQDTRRTSQQATQVQTGAGNGGGGGMGGMGGGGGNFLQSLFGGGGFSGAGMGTQGQSARRTLRAPLRVAFDVTRPTSTTVSTQFQNRLTTLPAFREIAPGVQISVENRVATLEGSVKTQRDKELVERLAKLEPGISDVKNNLTVQE